MKCKHPDSRSAISPENAHGLGRMVRWPRKLYQSGPRWTRWALFPFFFCLQSLRQIRPEFWVVEGTALGSNNPLSILCAANDMNRSYLAGLAFGETYSEYSIGRAWLWKANKMAAKKGLGHALMFIQVKMALRRLLGAGHWFFIPDWVSGVIDLPIERATMSSKSIRSDLTRIKRNALGFEVAHEPHLLDDFYHNMYAPYISGRHGKSALVIPYESMKRQFKNCDLLMITKQATSIAGVLILYSKAGPRIWCLGIRDGDPKYLQYGAAASIYYFSLQYLAGKGFKKVASGLSRAFMHDGVLGFKRKWAQRIIGQSSAMYALKILSYEKAAQDFLNNNPFIFEEHRSPHGAVFMDADKLDSPQRFEKIDKAYFYPGLSKLVVYLPQDCPIPEPSMVPPGLAERIVVRSADDIAIT